VRVAQQEVHMLIISVRTSRRGGAQCPRGWSSPSQSRRLWTDTVHGSRRPVLLLQKDIERQCNANHPLRRRNL